MYHLAAAACVASRCYEELIVHAEGTFPNTLIVAGLLATAMHIMKSAETA